MATRFSILIFLIFVLSLSSCMSVAPYQMMYLNDDEMKIKSSNVESFENAFQSYREGATGGASGKTGGGCGCN